MADVKEKAKGLVDYSSCSADENSALQPDVNMRRSKRPRTDRHLSDDADDLEEDHRMESFWNSEPFFSDTTSEGSDNDNCYTGNDVLMQRPYNWRAVLRRNLPEAIKLSLNCFIHNSHALFSSSDILLKLTHNSRISSGLYCLCEGKSPLKRDKCLKLLNEIDCCDRYLGRSVESCRAFFANLRQDEAAKMEDVRGVHHVIPRRLSWCDI